MIILLIGLTFLILSFASYALAFQINGINKIVYGTPVSIFESSILQDPNSTEPKVLFTKSLVEEKLDNYYEFSLRKFCKNYSYDIYFFDPEDHSLCMNDECKAVEISFEAELSFNYLYERTLAFQVQSNFYGS